MITNSELTIYHKELDIITRLEKWTRCNYDNVWFFGGKGAGLDKGYENANDVQIRIPYEKNQNININNFKIGDIIVKGKVEIDIDTQQDLGTNYEIYNITSIKNNNFGINKHVHLGGK